MPNTITSFTPGDLVISLSGDGDGSGTYGDNQATPITLEELTTGGVVAGTLVLPQTATTNAAGARETAISGEYGSSSEGTLELSADGQSLTIAGYGVNAATYNAGESNGNNAYGNAALAQSTSVPGGTYAAVPRVIADVSYNGTVDTSTALLNVDNTNNPRSAATVNGSSFILSGQGVKGDTTQGVQAAADGASGATIVNDATDTRTAEIYNGNLYVSTDSKQGAAGFTANIAAYNGIPTAGATPTILPGISQSVTLGGGNGNGVNGSSGSVNISPENFFFANSSTLYVADGGNPKGGGLGDGGLQKWSLNNGAWTLDYTLSSGLNLVSNKTADPGAGGQATTGLIGLTGQVNANGTVSLYATNATVGDLNQTALYGVTDTLADTTAAQASGEGFSTLATAAPDTNIRGVAFAPAAATACYASGTLIRAARGGVVADVAVERLAVGDLVVTAGGARRPVRWLGHRATDCLRHPEPRKVWPVRVRAGALGAGLPTTDLWLSPDHALCLRAGDRDEVLIPVRHLVDGGAIAQVEADTVTYWHVELDGHDILIANGAPAESYLDTGNRAAFDDASGVVDLHPDFAASQAPRPAAGFCRPLVESGPLLSAARAGLRGALQATVGAAGGDPIWLVADGRVVRGLVEARAARFIVPAGTRDLRLASPTRTPSETDSPPGADLLPGATLPPGADLRRLGVAINGIAIEADGFTTPVALDDPGLFAGFHAIERNGDGTWRWSDGEAHLADALWARCAGGAFMLHLGGLFASRPASLSERAAA